MSYKQVKLGSIGLTISIDDRLAERIRSNLFYRHLIRPALNALVYSKDTLRSKGKTFLPAEQPFDNQEGIPFKETPEQKAIIKQTADIDWYHSIDLGHGVVTPGIFDHRPWISYYPLSDDISGKRVLDVATFDGFWAFELEKRGALEVVAMDIESFNDADWPPLLRATTSKEVLYRETGTGFNVAKEILKSKVQRKIMNVYDLTPDWLGKFDIVFCSDLLLHLMNPMKALQNIHSVVSDYALIIDVFDPELGDDDSNTILRYRGARDDCVWWNFSLGSLEQMIRDAGFGEIELVSTFKFGFRGKEEKFWHAIFKAKP
jgi:tRNA (mo5U34)-methyltransferase